MAWTKKEQELINEIRSSIALINQRLDTTEPEIARLRDLELRLAKLEERRLSDDQAKTRTIAVLAVVLSACAILANLVVAFLKK